MSWAGLLDAAAGAGIAEDVFWDLLPREFRRRLDARARRVEAEQEAAWGRALLVANHVRTLINATVGKDRLDPLTLDDLRGGGPRPMPTAAEADALRLEIWRRKRAAGLLPPDAPRPRPFARPSPAEA